MKINLLKSLTLSGIAFTASIISLELSAAPPTYINPTGDEFPILAYHAFRPALINNENYRVLRMCGFNMAQGWCVDTTFISKSLEYAAQNNIKMLVNCPSTRSVGEISGLMHRYDAFPATAGYLLWDEPKPNQFEKMKSLISAVVETDPDKLAYVNMLPNYATSKAYQGLTYAEYLDSFVKTANPQFLSYDNYCIYERDDALFLRDNYFENLEIAYKVCDSYGIPLWTFCLTTAHYSYPVPNEGQLLFEAFSGLSYGSKCIQSYGYATSEIDGIPLTTAPIDSVGNRRKVWYALQKANRQIQAAGRYLLPCKTVGVWHTGHEIPKGTRALKRTDLPRKFSYVVSESKGVVVSLHKDGEKNYLLIVNRDFVHKQKVQVGKDRDVRRITATGKIVTDNSHNVMLKPGGWCLYTW